ncbi:MAG: hypothetical protein KGQ77_00120, partial [Betaproteobacteria bacterium]|nr:hypothetical protein [Betaproteobacteria bacterium]
MRRSSWIAGEVLALAVMATATLGWMAFTSSGGQALLAVVQWASAGALSVAGAQGALLGNFQADHVQWHTPGGQGRIEQLAWQFDTRRLRFARLSAREVELSLPASASPGAPASLALPVSIGADAIDIGTLTLHEGSSTTQLAQLSGSLSLGTRQHRWQLAGQVAQLRVATQGTLDTQAPFATHAVADLRPADPAQAALDWAARLQADGPLTALPLTAQVRARGQSLDATATLTPWGVSALSAVHLQLRDFDIAPLLAGAPRTTLSGTIDAQLTTGAPLRVDAQLHNGTAGPWDRGLLPLIDVTARGSGDRSSGRFDALEARVPGGGHVSGTAQWHTSVGQSAVDWRADLTLAQVRPALLHTAVTPMQLGGQLHLQGRSGGLQSAPLEVRAQLRGRLDDARLAQRDVSVNADAQIGADSLTLRQLRATSGTAGLDLSCTVNQLHSTRRFDLQARLRAFTPDAWLRTGYTALLNADATAQGSWPRAQRMPQSLQGTLQWRDSAVQGLPTQGNVQWAMAQGNAGSSAVRVSSQGTLDVAGQQAQWSGAYGQPGDRLRLDWQVPQLQRLQALIALITPMPATLAGKLHGQLTLDSRADAPRLSGSMQGERLQWGTSTANTVTARVEAGPRPDDTLALDVAVNGLHVAALDRVTTGANDRINLNARVQGTWAAHDIALRTEATVSQHPLQLQLDVKGALRGGVMAATQWHGSGTAAVVEDGLAWAR